MAPSIKVKIVHGSDITRILINHAVPIQKYPQLWPQFILGNYTAAYCRDFGRGAGYNLKTKFDRHASVVDTLLQHTFRTFALSWRVTFVITIGDCAGACQQQATPLPLATRRYGWAMAPSNVPAEINTPCPSGCGEISAGGG